MRLFFTLLLVISAIEAYANQSIRGIVADKSGSGISFASIALLEHSDSSLVKGTIANENGVFELQNVQVGSFVLRVSVIGYHTIMLEISVDPAYDYSSIITIKMIESTHQLDEIVVKGEKPLFEQRIDRTIINVKESVSNVGSSALEVLSKSPGVDVDRVGNTLSLVGKSGVIVMLNGKRTRMDGAALIQLLEGMSSNNIEKIELFTTPPANYDAEGTAGMINIITTRNQDDGFNGNISMNIGHSIRPKYGSSVNLNYRKNQLYIYGDLSTNNDLTRQDVTINAATLNEGISSENNLFSRRPAYVGMHRFNIGLDYEISPGTIVGGIVNGYISDWDMTAESTTTSIQDSDITSIYLQDSEEVNYWKNIGYNLNIRHRINDQLKASFDYDYLGYDNNNPTDYFEVETDVNGAEMSSRNYFSRKYTPLSFHVFKADLSGTLNEKISVEAGFKKTISDFKNDVRFAVLNESTPVYDAQLTDKFEMDENITAGYLSANYQLDKQILIKAGMRYERNLTYLESESEGTLVDRNRGRFFPTLFINYELSKSSSLGVSYSKRISRPSFRTLAPAYYFFDRNTVLAGNASLQSIISNQIKVDYVVNDLSVSFQYSDQENPIAWGQASYNNQGTLVIRAEHIRDRKVGSVNLNYSKKLTDWWSGRVNIGGYWQREAPGLQSDIPIVERYYYQMNLTQNYTLPQDFSLEWRTSVRSRRQYGANSSPARGSMTLGLQKKFTNQSILSLTWTDVFDQGSFFQLESDRNVLDDSFDFLYQFEGNVVRLTYSMMIGNKALKSKRRASGSVEERNRAD